MFHLIEPMDVIYTKNITLANLAEIVGLPLSDEQKIDLGYVILQGAFKFKSKLKTWDKKY